MGVPNIEDWRLKWPFTMIVAGPSGCGKSTFVGDVLRDVENAVVRTPAKIIVAYSQMQPLYAAFIANAPCPVQLVDGLTADLETEPGTLLVLDDLQGGDQKKIIRDWFTIHSHHYDTSVVFLVQNVFEKTAEHRTISLNAHYMVIFKNPRDGSQITHLARQMFPQNAKRMIDAYKEATSRPHSHLVVDLTQETPDLFRLRDALLPHSDLCKS